MLLVRPRTDGCLPGQMLRHRRRGVGRACHKPEEWPKAKRGCWADEIESTHGRLEVAREFGRTLNSMNLSRKFRADKGYAVYVHFEAGTGNDMISPDFPYYLPHLLLRVGRPCHCFLLPGEQRCAHESGPYLPHDHVATMRHRDRGACV